MVCSNNRRKFVISFPVCLVQQESGVAPVRLTRSFTGNFWMWTIKAWSLLVHPTIALALVELTRQLTCSTTQAAVTTSPLRFIKYGRSMWREELPRLFGAAT